jgi:hypothetical protein
MNYDPYQDGLRILDTDYSNYMVIYHCYEHDEEEEEEEN